MLVLAFKSAIAIKKVKIFDEMCPNNKCKFKGKGSQLQIMVWLDILRH